MLSEESEQQVTALKSQYEQQVAQLQRDLEEARRGSSGAGQGATPSEQLQQEKDRLASENTELQNKVQLSLFGLVKDGRHCLAVMMSTCPIFDQHE